MAICIFVRNSSSRMKGMQDLGRAPELAERFELDTSARIRKCPHFFGIIVIAAAVAEREIVPRRKREIIFRGPAFEHEEYRRINVGDAVFQFRNGSIRPGAPLRSMRLTTGTL